MLSIHFLVIGNIDYLLDRVQPGEYYLDAKPGEPAGVFLGFGAHTMGLGGTVTPEQFRSLYLGFDPSTNQPLVQNAGQPNRQPAWDFTFSANKYVSVALSAVDPSERKTIQQCMRDSVEATLGIAEEHLVFSRAGKGGIDLVPGGLVVAAYEHWYSRSLDQQLHWHCVAFSLVVNGTKIRALLSWPLYARKKVLGAFQRAFLAYSLSTRLGFRCIRQGDNYRLQGIPEWVVDAVSKRAKQLRTYMAEHNMHGPKAAEYAALQTRRPLENPPSREELLQYWQQVNRSLGFDASHIQRQVAVPGDPREAIAQAVENLVIKRPHFSFVDLLYETLLELPQRVISPKGIVEEIQKYLATEPHIVHLPAADRETRFTTRRVLQEEQRLLHLLRQSSQSLWWGVPPGIVERIIAKAPTIRDEQAAAVRFLTQPGGSLRIMQGLAGTGKTFAISLCLPAWRKQGYRVIGLAPTGTAAKVLQNATGIESQTIHSFLGEVPELGRLARARRTVRSIRRHLKSKRRRRHLKSKRRRRRHLKSKQRRPKAIDPRTIVVIDETAMADRPILLKLIKPVKAGGGKLVFLGDSAQLPAIEHGSPFLSLCNRFPHVALNDVRRQTETWAQQAVYEFAAGDPARAMAMFASRGLLVVNDTRRQSLDAIVRDWSSIGLSSPDRARILVTQNEDSEECNRLCQHRRLQAGCLDRTRAIPIYDVTKSGRVYRNLAFIGDRVLFTRNQRRLGVENGLIGTVVAMSARHNSIAVRVAPDRVVQVPLGKYRSIRLGYSTTAHKAQGATIDYCHVLLDESGTMQNRPLSYVEASRAKHCTRFYTEKKFYDESRQSLEESPLAAAMSVAPDLSMATDLLEQAPAGPKTTAIHTGLFPGRRRSHAQSNRTPKPTSVANPTSPTQPEQGQPERGAAQSEWDHRRKAESSPSAYRPGDRVRFLKHCPRTQVCDGDQATVIQLDSRQQVAFVRMDTGRILPVVLAEQQIALVCAVQQLEQLEAAEIKATQELEQLRQLNIGSLSPTDTPQSASPSPSITTNVATSSPNSSSSSSSSYSGNQSILSSPLTTVDYSTQQAQLSVQQAAFQFAGAAQTATTQQNSSTVRQEIRQGM